MPALDMPCFLVHVADIMISIFGFINAGVKFCAINQAVQLVQLRYIDKLPLNNLLLHILKCIFFGLADLLCFLECFCLISGVDQPELFIKLRGVRAFAANDLKYDFSQIPVHNV